MFPVNLWQIFKHQALIKRCNLQHKLLSNLTHLANLNIFIILFYLNFIWGYQAPFLAIESYSWTTGIYNRGLVLLCDAAHPRQLAHRPSSTESRNKPVTMLSVTTNTSCSLCGQYVAPVAAAVPDPTTPASESHRTPLNTGAMIHHTVWAEDIGQVLAGKTQAKYRHSWVQVQLEPGSKIPPNCSNCDDLLLWPQKRFEWKERKKTLFSFKQDLSFLIGNETSITQR